MFEKDETTKKIEFSHNPFSMPQGNLTEENFEKPLDILAYQYDIVCNGIELSSGAIRNHKPELMYKLFSIAGYDKKQVDEKFSGMINALSYGAPPHGGIAPGIDRIVMLLANEKNIREVTPAANISIKNTHGDSIKIQPNLADTLGPQPSLRCLPYGATT